MKSLRKRAIEKAMVNHVLNAIDLIMWNESIGVICGSALLPTKREIELLNTLEHYANIADRIFDEEVQQKEWVIELSMYL